MTKQSKKKDKNNQWYELGSLRKNTTTGKSYLVLNKNVSVLVEGVEVDLGQFRMVSLVDPTTGLDALLSGGFIDDSEYDKRLAFIEEKNVRYKLTVPPAAHKE